MKRSSPRLLSLNTSFPGNGNRGQFGNPTMFQIRLTPVGKAAYVSEAASKRKKSAVEYVVAGTQIAPEDWLQGEIEMNTEGPSQESASLCRC